MPRQFTRTPYRPLFSMEVANFPKAGSATNKYIAEAQVTPSGSPILNVREWYTDRDSGELRPGKQGMAIPLDNIPEFYEAFNKGIVELERYMGVGQDEEEAES